MDYDRNIATYLSLYALPFSSSGRGSWPTCTRGTAFLLHPKPASSSSIAILWSTQQATITAWHVWSWSRSIVPRHGNLDFSTPNSRSTEFLALICAWLYLRTKYYTRYLMRLLFIVGTYMGSYTFFEITIIVIFIKILLSYKNNNKYYYCC